ncbi:MAG: hypothetical protein OXJ53_21510 [Gammaproteobacteria bacterium]|nr:hypothetical protein [Gammaproteobacteria bacterium]MDE0270535.1 hypothetical protein [Gammaproteobacteria bacterium]
MSALLPKASELADRVAQIGQDAVINEFALRRITATAGSPKALLDAAAEISIGGREVDWRNSVSRGYYVAYHRCILVAYGDASAQPSHRQLIDQLTDSKASVQWRQAGHLLQQCKQLREQADYRTVDNFEQADAETALGAGRWILKFADRA